MWRPDLIIIGKKEQEGIIIDIAAPADVSVEEKEKRKSGKVPGFEERDQKILEIKECINCPSSETEKGIESVKTRVFC